MRDDPRARLHRLALSGLAKPPARLAPTPVRTPFPLAEPCVQGARVEAPQRAHHDHRSQPAATTWEPSTSSSSPSSRRGRCRARNGCLTALLRPARRSLSGGLPEHRCLVQGACQRWQRAGERPPSCRSASGGIASPAAPGTKPSEDHAPRSTPARARLVRSVSYSPICQ